MPGHDIIVVGASAGGVETLCNLVRDLPADLPASIFIVLHLPSNGKSVMAEILNRASLLKASCPTNNEVIQYGHIYVAPPNYHLLVKRGVICLSQGPKENSHRPAVDPLFRTAARAYGRRVVGVILSGTLDDGTAGLLAVKSRGGIAVVQDPDEAMFPGMPQNAVDNVNVDRILPVKEIAALLVRLANDLVIEEDAEPVSDAIKLESDIAEFDMAAIEGDNQLGTLAGFGCPTCGGTLWEVNEGKLLRFRCRVGHAWSEDSLISQQADALEEALWTALRALEESAALSRRLARRARDRNQERMAIRFDSEEQETKERAALIRKVLLKNDNTEISHF